MDTIIKCKKCKQPIPQHRYEWVNICTDCSARIYIEKTKRGTKQ